MAAADALFARRGAISDALQDLINSGGAVETDWPLVLHDVLERYRGHPQVDCGDALLRVLAAERLLLVASFNHVSCSTTAQCLSKNG